MSGFARYVLVTTAGKSAVGALNTNNLKGVGLTLDDGSTVWIDRENVAKLYEASDGTIFPHINHVPFGGDKGCRA